MARLCLIVVSGNQTAVRRFYADGSERPIVRMSPQARLDAWILIDWHVLTFSVLPQMKMWSCSSPQHGKTREMFDFWPLVK